MPWTVVCQYNINILIENENTINEISGLKGVNPPENPKCNPEKGVCVTVLGKNSSIGLSLKSNNYDISNYLIEFPFRWEDNAHLRKINDNSILG